MLLLTSSNKVLEKSRFRYVRRYGPLPQPGTYRKPGIKPPTVSCADPLQNANLRAVQKPIGLVRRAAQLRLSTLARTRTAPHSLRKHKQASLGQTDA